MAVMREIRTRIKSVANTQQITKAMKMVAASKLRRVVSSTPPLKECTEAITAMLKELISSDSRVDNIYVNKREVKKVLYILVVGDMGLCGMYNTAVSMYMKKILEEEETRDREVWVVGKWGSDVLKNLGIECTERLECISDVPTPKECMDLSADICKKYTDGEYDEIHFVYEEFVNTMIQQPVDFQFLPVEASKEKSKKLTSKEAASLIKPKPDETAEKQQSVLVEIEVPNTHEPKEYYFQPDKETVINTLIDKYLKATVYTIMLEARSGEHSARMTAMTNATENTEKLMAKLQLMYNRARQEAITTEISEIVGGASALKK